MATQKYKVEKTTIDKIKKLFAYRRITDMLKASELDKNKDLAADIINVQYHIYMLDGYLESQWPLDKKDIEKYWNAILAALDSMGYSGKKVVPMVKEIEEYEKIERNLRKDKWPTKVAMQDFYRTKSCDVRLIRQLIYRAHPALSEIWKEKAWKYYDIITEINDDIADIMEDVKTFNGNRYLISILRKGAEKTHKEYQKFLESIIKKANKYFTEKADRGKNSQLAIWTAERGAQTLKLLETNINSKNLDKLSSSLLLSHMH